MWFGSCPRCRQRAWDFTKHGMQPPPGSPEWEDSLDPNKDGWYWTPTLPSPINPFSGYRVVVEGQRSTDIALTVRFANGVEIPIAYNNCPSPIGTIYYWTIGNEHKYIFSAGRVLYPPHPTSSVTIPVCFSDADGYLLIDGMSIPGKDTTPSIPFIPPRIFVPRGVTYIALEGMSSKGTPGRAPGCCHECLSKPCVFSGGLPVEAFEGTPFVIYTIPTDRAVEVMLPVESDTPPFVKFTVGECCVSDDGELGGIILEVTFDLSANTLTCHYQDCIGERDETRTYPWRDIYRDWGVAGPYYTFTLHMYTNDKGNNVMQLATRNSSGWYGSSVVTTVNDFLPSDLFENLLYCHQEFEGEGDPKELFDLNRGCKIRMQTDAQMIHYAHYTDSHVYNCAIRGLIPYGSSPPDMNVAPQVSANVTPQTTIPPDLLVQCADCAHLLPNGHCYKFRGCDAHRWRALALRKGCRFHTPKQDG